MLSVAHVRRAAYGAGGVNTKFILEQRAEMRARLIQYAVDKELYYNTARLQAPAPGMWEQELEL